MKKTIILLFTIILSLNGFGQNKFNGFDMNMGNLFRLSDAKTRSISPENFTGEKGKGGMADPADQDKPNVANVCYWYQTEPHAKFSKLPGWKELEIY
ncbi:MAG: hypothetical protein KBG40_08190 [Bacteroidales bacterium]|nr:hypothetical protein [Bacteroidales bacterium]